MLNFRTTYISYLAAVLLYIVLFWIYSISWIYLLVISVIFITVIIFGVFNISFNFFIKTYSFIKTDKKEVAITFDDGPSEKNTEEVLEVLSNRNIKAAFFCIGNKIEQNGKIIKRIHNEGHLIGNHTYSHSWTFGFSSTSYIISELDKTNQLIMNHIGKNPVFFRPPFGVTNPMIAKAVNSLDLKVVGWNVRSLDTLKTREKALMRIKKKLKPGSIILLHDRIPGAHILLEELLNYLDENAYKVIRLDTLLGIDND